MASKKTLNTANQYIIKNDEARKYFYEEYKKIDINVTPGHFPNFKTIEEVDKWISFMEKVQVSMNEYFDNQ